MIFLQSASLAFGISDEAAVIAYDLIAQELADGIVAGGTLDYGTMKTTVNGREYSLSLLWNNIRNKTIAEENGLYKIADDGWLTQEGNVTYPKWFEGTISLVCDITLSSQDQSYYKIINNASITLPPPVGMTMPNRLDAHFDINESTSTNQFQAVRYNKYIDCVTLNKNGAIGLILPCDAPCKQYVTVKLSGDDVKKGMLFLADGESGYIGNNGTGVPLTCGIVDRKDRPELCFNDGEAQAPGKFIYATYMIPECYVKKDEKLGYYVALRLYSTGARNNYSTPHISEQMEESQRIYSVYISSSPSVDFKNETSEISYEEANPYSPSEKSVLISRFRNALEVFLRRQVYSNSVLPSLNGMFTRTESVTWDKTLSGADMSTFYNSYQALAQNMTPLNGIEIMAKAYKYSETLGLEENRDEYLIRAILGIDFLCRSQGADGGWYSSSGWIGGGADSQKSYTSDGRLNSGGNNLTGFGLRSAGEGLSLILDKIPSKTWNELIDTNCDGYADTKRVDAWAQMLAAGRDYLVDNPLGYGHAPNQDMADLVAALRFEYCLEKLNKMGLIKSSFFSSYLKNGENVEFNIWGAEAKKIEECLDIAFGLKQNKALFSYWVSPKGIIMENFGSVSGGYSGDYSTNAVVLMGQLAELSTVVCSEKSDVYINILKKAYDSVSNFYFLRNDADNNEMLCTEGLISERNNYYPGSKRYPADYFGVSLGIEPATEILRYSILHDYEKAERGAHFEDNAINVLDLIINWDMVQDKILLNSSYSLPATGDQSFGFADEMAHNAVIKNGDEKLYIALNWRNPLHSQKYYVQYGDDGEVTRYAYGMINNKARVHHVFDEYDSYGIVGMTTLDSNMSDSTWSPFDEYQYLRGIMLLEYDNYYLMMNSTGLAGDEPVEKYSIGDLASKMNIPNGVYVNLITYDEKNPVCYVVGDAPDSSPLGTSYMDADAVYLMGSETYALCSLEKLKESQKTGFLDVVVNNGMLDSVDISLPNGISSAILACAEYSCEGALVGVFTTTVALGKNDLDDLKVGTNAKLFLWNEDYQPYCTAYEIK